MSDSDPPITDPSAGSAATPNHDGTPVCPHCMADVAPDADFCQRCGDPLSSLATMDPYKQIFAQGYIYREAASRPKSWIVLLGMWLIFTPMVMAASCSLISNSLSLQQMGPGLIQPVLFLLFGLGLLVLYSAILFRVTSRYFVQRSRIKNRVCIECGYNLTGLSVPRCPECGSSFDPEEVYSSQNDDENGEPSEFGSTDLDTVQGPADQKTQQPSDSLGRLFLIGVPILIALWLGIIAYHKTIKHESGGALFGVVAVVVLFLLGFQLSRSSR